MNIHYFQLRHVMFMAIFEVYIHSTLDSWWNASLPWKPNVRPVHGQPAVFQIESIRAFDGVQTNDSNGHFFLFVRVLSLHGSNLGKKRKESKANPPDSLSIFGLKLKSLGHLVENLKNISFKIAHSSSSRSKCSPSGGWLGLSSLSPCSPLSSISSFSCHIKSAEDSSVEMPIQKTCGSGCSCLQFGCLDTGVKSH